MAVCQLHHHDKGEEMTTAAATTNDLFRFGSFRLSGRSSAKRERIKKLNNNQTPASDRVVFAVREENGKNFSKINYKRSESLPMGGGGENVLETLERENNLES